MKVLLIALNAKYIHSCLAIHSLKAYALDHIDKTSQPVQIDTLEYTINQPLDDILSDICDRIDMSEDACLIAFSCYIWNIEYVKKVALLLSHAIPAAKIWVGGPEVSYSAEEFLQENPSVTGVMTGEGEGTFTSLVQAYQSDTLHSIPGIVFRADDNSIITNPPAALLDLDDLVFPYPDQSALEHHILYYESSRGCPFGCSYCLSSIDRRVRFKSLEKVFEELQIFLDQHVPLVKFVDRTFNCDHKRTLAIWQFLKEHDNGITRFHFEVTAELLNEEELSLISTMRPGLIQLEIGVQSANPDTLDAIDRKQDISHLAQITETIRSGQNIHQHLDLIAGLPFENLESFSRSFDTVYQMKPDQLQLGFLKVLKGSKMHRLRDEYGLRYRPWPPYEVISTKWISATELLSLKAIEEMVEIYYNSGQFQLTLTYLMHFFSRPWDFFLRFATWMKENGHLGISHNRLQKYSLLRDFTIHTLQNSNVTIGVNHDASKSIDRSALDFILLYDLYLREKVKTRPAWAPDQTTQKEKISSLYANEEIRHIYLSDFQSDTTRQIRHETHIEIFPIDVWATANSGDRVDREQVMLFSYRQKNPLDGSAKVKTILA